MALLRPLMRCSLYTNRVLVFETGRSSRIVRHSSSAISSLSTNRSRTSPNAQGGFMYRFINDDKTKTDLKTPKDAQGEIEKGAEGKANVQGKKLTQVQRLRKVFAEYGSTAVIFHVSISLTSLGICYCAVKSGLDVPLMLQKIGLSKSIADSSVTSGASTFVIAYACHKVFAPVRMFLTITCTPLIVRRLRIMGILKTPLKQN